MTDTYDPIGPILPDKTMLIQAFQSVVFLWQREYIKTRNFSVQALAQKRMPLGFSRNFRFGLVWTSPCLPTRLEKKPDKHKQRNRKVFVEGHDIQ